MNKSFAPSIIHLIDFSRRNSWIEDQMDFFKKQGMPQGLLTISPPGEIHDAVIENDFNRVQCVNRSVSGLIRACFLLKTWSKQEKVYIYAHGHLAAIYASFIRSFTGIDYVICHHQQPEYFFLLRKRMPLRASTHRALARFYLARARIIQSFSPEVTRNLKQKKIKARKIVEIPLGIDFDKYFEIDRKLLRQQDLKAIQIVSVSRLVWEKRLDLGIRSVAHLVNCGVNVEYSIVGEGPELSYLNELIKDLGMERHVTLLGRREDVNKILNISDIFFHLSLTESYGQVLMEARLTGTPIFSSACGVALEMQALQDPAVYVFNCSDPRTVANELLSFLRTLESQTNLVVTNPQNLYRSHDYENVLLKVESMFEELFELDS